MSVAEEEMPPFVESVAEAVTPLEVTTDESPQLTRRKVVEALKLDLDELREAQPEVHVPIPNGIPPSEPGTTPYGTLSRSQSRRGSYLFALGMTAGDDIAATFTEEPFRHNAQKYQCCFHQIHCKQGARYILLIGIIAIIVNIFSMIFVHPSFELLGFQGILFIFAVIAYVFLFLAMKKENEIFLWPIIIFLVFDFLIFIAILVIAIWTLIDPKAMLAEEMNHLAFMRGNQTDLADHGLEENKQEIEIASSALVAVSALGIAICLWFLFTIVKYYLYLRDMKRARHPQTIVYHGDFKNVKVTELTQ
ncbi:unnamed protein product, partial [Mesorhabditis belari]|uniref:MARVEL domain-containing protein n=1 Tax=Mesorhabditis belari TaxID=2138241 RepID=A0AAF3ETG3_9BILA